MTDPNRSVADELEEVEREIALMAGWEAIARIRGWNVAGWDALQKRAAALRYDFALLAYAGRTG